jgi:hypothetical protein
LQELIDSVLYESFNFDINDNDATSCDSSNTDFLDFDFDLTYSDYTNVSGIFNSSNTITYGPGFNGFTFSAIPSGAHTINSCKYSESDEGFSGAGMTGFDSVISNNYTVSTFTPTQTTHTFYIACETTHTIETLEHNEEITYNFDLQEPVIQSVNNDTGYLSSIPVNVTIATDENSKCQINTVQGYDYGVNNCTNSFNMNKNCSLSSIILSEGVNNFYISCLDELGNNHGGGDSRLVTYTIDLTKPYATLNGSTYYYTQHQQYNSF